MATFLERVRLEELEMEDNITLVEKMESLYDIAPKLIKYAMLLHRLS